MAFGQSRNGFRVIGAVGVDAEFNALCNASQFEVGVDMILAAEFATMGDIGYAEDSR